AAAFTNSSSSSCRSTLLSAASSRRWMSMRSCTNCSRVSGSACGSFSSIAASRFSIDSGVRLRPRRGLWASSASRYRRTALPCSRPSANAALWVSDMGVLALFGFAGISGILDDRLPVFKARHWRLPGPCCNDSLQDRRFGGTLGYGEAVLATGALHRSLGLTDDELVAIEGILGREPNELELAMYAVMWSEHCSYKS